MLNIFNSTKYIKKLLSYSINLFIFEKDYEKFVLFFINVVVAITLYAYQVRL